MEDLADTRLAPKISQLSGVGLVSISGGQKPAVRVQANPTKLSSLGLNMEDVRTAIAATNVNQAKGNFDGAKQNYTVEDNDQLLASAAVQARDHRLSQWRAGAAGEVATVVDSAENIQQAAWMNDTPP